MTQLTRPEWGGGLYHSKEEAGDDVSQRKRELPTAPELTGGAWPATRRARSPTEPVRDNTPSVSIPGLHKNPRP